MLQTLFCFIFHVFFTHYFLVLFSYIVLEMMISISLLSVDRSCLRIVFKTRPGTSNTHTIARDIATSNSLSLSRRRWLLSWRWCVNAAQMHFLAHVDDAIQGTGETKAQVIRPPRPSPFLPSQKMNVSWSHRACKKNKDTYDDCAFMDAKQTRQSHLPHSSDRSRHDRPRSESGK